MDVWIALYIPVNDEPALPDNRASNRTWILLARFGEHRLVLSANSNVVISSGGEECRQLARITRVSLREWSVWPVVNLPAVAEISARRTIDWPGRVCGDLYFSWGCVARVRIIRQHGITDVIRKPPDYIQQISTSAIALKTVRLNVRYKTD